MACTVPSARCDADRTVLRMLRVSTSLTSPRRAYSGSPKSEDNNNDVAKNVFDAELADEVEAETPKTAPPAATESVVGKTEKRGRTV